MEGLLKEALYVLLILGSVFMPVALYGLLRKYYRNPSTNRSMLHQNLKNNTPLLKGQPNKQTIVTMDCNQGKAPVVRLVNILQQHDCDRTRDDRTRDTPKCEAMSKEIDESAPVTISVTMPDELEIQGQASGASDVSTSDICEYSSDDGMSYFEFDEPEDLILSREIYDAGDVTQDRSDGECEVIRYDDDVTPNWGWHSLDEKKEYNPRRSAIVEAILQADLFSDDDDDADETTLPWKTCQPIQDIRLSLETVDAGDSTACDLDLSY